MICKIQWSWTKTLSPGNSYESWLLEEKKKVFAVYNMECASPCKQLWSRVLASTSHSILQSGDRLLFILCTTTLILSVLLKLWTVIFLSYSFTKFLLLSDLANDTVLQKSSRSLDLSSSQSKVYRNPLSKQEWYKRGKFFVLVPEHCKS